jgi:hypothetical protein
MPKPNFGSALSHKERMPQVYLRKQPKEMELIPFSATVEFDWHNYILLVVIVIGFLIGVNWEWISSLI